MKIFSEKLPWYAAGLAFECVRCGRCCAGPEEGYVWATGEEIVAIALHLGVTEAEVRRKYVRKVARRFSLIEREGNRDCVFLSYDAEGLSACRIYPVRPLQCRTWPFWPTNLQDAEAWCRASRRCGGINRGPLHEFDEIRSKSRRTDP